MPLRLGCCEFFFCQSGPGRRCYCSTLQKELDFFFLFFPAVSLRVDSRATRQCADLIRTFLSDLFTKGPWLYL